MEGEAEEVVGVGDLHLQDEGLVQGHVTGGAEVEAVPVTAAESEAEVHLITEKDLVAGLANQEVLQTNGRRLDALKVAHAIRGKVCLLASPDRDRLAGRNHYLNQRVAQRVVQKAVQRVQDRNLTTAMKSRQMVIALKKKETQMGMTMMMRMMGAGLEVAAKIELVELIELNPCTAVCFIDHYYLCHHHCHASFIYVRSFMLLSLSLPAIHCLL